MIKRYKVIVTAVIQRNVRVSVSSFVDDTEAEAEQKAIEQIEKDLGFSIDDVQDCYVEEIDGQQSDNSA